MKEQFILCLLTQFDTQKMTLMDLNKNHTKWAVGVIRQFVTRLNLDTRGYIIVMSIKIGVRKTVKFKELSN